MAIVCVHHGLTELKAHTREESVGGEYFDNLLVIL